MNLQELRTQYRGRKFGELVLQHAKRMNQETLVSALAGTIRALPSAARPLAEDWIDEITGYGTEPSFWQNDAGQTFALICSAAKDRLAEAGINVSDDDIFNMFQIILLNFVYGLHKNPQSKAFIQQSIGIGFLRRLFG